MPRMIVVAGPPGGGKSTAFPVSSFGVEHFNADDRAAALNDGSYRGIPAEIRTRVNREFEAFVNEHIRARKSFAFETTLRTAITLRQAEEAKRQGYSVVMNYVALGSMSDHLERIAIRAETGGHAASSSTLLRIYDASLRNLVPALRSLDQVEVYDNAAFGVSPKLVFGCRKGEVVDLAPEPEVPAWLANALKSTEYEITPQLRTELAANRAWRGRV